MYASQPSTQPEPVWPPLSPDPQQEANGLTGQALVPPPVASAPSAIPPPPTSHQAVPIAAARTAPAWIRVPTSRPFFTPIILALLVAIFAGVTFQGALDPERQKEILLAWGAKQNSLVLDGEWWRLITSTFLHGGTLETISMLHMLSNGYALFMIGMDLEAFFGRARFLAVYAISALAGSVASFAFSPLYVLGLGASGAIFGLIGALGVYFGLHRSLFGRMGQAQFWNIIVVIVLNVGIGLSGALPIDNSAHVGGLLAGAAVGYVLCPRYALGDWKSPDVREVHNTNKGPLSGLATLLIGLNVVFLFFVILLLMKNGIYNLSSF